MSGSLAETDLKGLARPGAEKQSQAVVRSPFRDAMRKLFTNKLAIVGMLMIGSVILVAFIAPWLASQHPDKNGVFEAFPRNNKLPPSIEHLMGTDVIGRDMLSLVIYGARISLLVGVFAVSLAIIVGATLGAIAGFAGGLKVKAVIEKDWLDTEGINSLNYRVAVGALGEAFVLGRAFTAAERDKALAVVRNTSGVTNVVDYVEVRPKEG